MVPRKSRILFVLPSLSRGGAELQTISLLQGMNPDKYEKHLLCFSGTQRQIEAVERGGVTLHCLMRNGRVDIALFRDMAGLFDRLKPDVVYCALLYSYFNAFWARRMSSSHPPLVVSVHTTVNRSLKNELFERSIYRMLLPRAQRIVFVSSRQREFWARKYAFVKRSSVVVHNGVDTAFFSPLQSPMPETGLRKSLNIPEGAGILLCIAAFRPEKGHKVLVEALSGMDDPPYLLLAGDGARRREIEEAVGRGRLSERVRFLGVVDDVRPYLSIASLSVLPSVAVETFSMAMLESMAMGVPVLGSDIGGMSEAVLPGRTGWLVPPGDAAVLRKTICEAMSDYASIAAMGEQGRALVIERFSRERMIKQITKLFDSVLGNHG
jgi:glycosyltransferase involved in cell wall biosynthesis